MGKFRVIYDQELIGEYDLLASNNVEKVYNKRIFQISKVELEAHEAFLKSEIKKNFY